MRGVVRAGARQVCKFPLVPQPTPPKALKHRIQHPSDCQPIIPVTTASIISRAMEIAVEHGKLLIYLDRSEGAWAGVVDWGAGALSPPSRGSL
jgi:hypothetical protein